MVMGCGRRRHLQVGDFLFRHGDPHEGVYLVESGLVRTYYSSASGREITLA
jgi:CRP-like cAMP-binding protein